MYGMYVQYVTFTTQSDCVGAEEVYQGGFLSVSIAQQLASAEQKFPH